MPLPRLSTLFQSFLLLFLFLYDSSTTTAAAAAMANRVRVAVLGSGVSGATAARALAEKGLQVTVVEAGHGIGGRTSTRITNVRDTSPDAIHYQFDHGAQYMGRPKTEAFRLALDDWQARGWVRPWDGKFADEVGDGTVVVEDQPKERFVGYPGMHSICQGLLQHDNIDVVLHTRADAVFDESARQWQLANAKANSSLGTFDWLVASDRLSIGDRRSDLPKKDLKGFRQSVKNVQNVKCLTAMVVFESPVDIPLDGVRFSGESQDDFGCLGWIARDSSKPGRQRTDGHECWVLQTHPHAAHSILNSINGRPTVDRVRQRAKEALVEGFLKAIPKLATAGGGSTPAIPPIKEAIGHRWGAAFPVVKDGSGLSMEESGMDESKRFVSCGDYYGVYAGRIEGAYLSGASAAAQLNHHLEQARLSGVASSAAQNE